MASLHQGKQRAAKEQSGPKRASAQEPERSFRERGRPEYSDVHERVFRAPTEAQVDQAGEGVHLDEVSRAAGLSREETRALLHDLMVTHGLVTELRGADDPDLGPRYEAKPRL